jgi:tripeptidyl-peptidase I
LTLYYRPYTTWLDFVLAQPHLPLAISTSYGDDEQTGTYSSRLSAIAGSNRTTVPKSFAERACAGFAQLGAVTFQPLLMSDYLKLRMTGARGISIMFSSGDNGVGDGNPDPVTQQCFSNANDKNITVFIPDFPASCVIFVFRSNDEHILTPINRCPL